IEWKKPDSGFATEPVGDTGGLVICGGYGSPQLAGTGGPLTIKGMEFTTQSSSQNSVYSDQPGSKFENDAFIVGSNQNTSTPLIIGGGGFQDRMRDIYFGGIPNVQVPLVGGCGNCGLVMFWPVPAINVIAGPSNQSNLIWEGLNYGVGVGIQIDQLYPGAGTSMGYLEISNVQTFQEPWQPFLQLQGQNLLSYLHMEKIAMDSIALPPIYSSTAGSCLGLIAHAVTPVGYAYPTLTGYPCRSTVTEWEDGGGAV